MLAGAGADIDHMIGDSDGVLVVLDDNDRVTDVSEPLEGFDQLGVVALVEADGGLIQDIEHADEPRTDLAGQSNTLRLATGQRCRRSPEAEVVEPHIEEEAQSAVDLLDDTLGDEQLPLGQLEPGQHLRRLTDRHRTDVGHRVAIDQAGERQRVESRPVTGRAVDLPHVALDLLALAVRLRLGVTTPQIGQDALEVGVVGSDPPVAVLVPNLDALAVGRTVQQELLLLGPKLLPRCIARDAVLVTDRLDEPAEVSAAVPRPRMDRPVGHRQGGIRHDELWVDFERRPKTIARAAGAVGRVEREVSGSEFFEALAIARPGQVLAEDEGFRRMVGALWRHDLDLGDALGQPERSFHRIGEPTLDSVPPHQAIHHDLDVVHLVAFELGQLAAELDQLVIDNGAGEPLRCQVAEERLVGALAAAHDRRQHLEAGAVLETKHLIDDLLWRLLDQLFAGLRIMGRSDTSEQKPEVVIDLGHRAHGGARVATGGLLIDRDGRREAFDEVDVGFVHLAEELSGVGRQ